MRNAITNHKYIVSILSVVLLVFGFQSISYGQTLTASTPQPLTEAKLDGSVVTLMLNGGTYERWLKKEHANAFKVSGIAGVTLKSTFDSFNPFFDVQRVSNTAVTVELGFSGNIDTDATLTFTVGAAAIANYNGPALTADVFVTSSNERGEAPTTQNQEEPVSATTVEIQGPWLWMVVPTDSTAGGGISTEIDSLADASGGSITETHVAQNGVNEGDAIGQLQWISSEIHWSEHQYREYEVERRPGTVLTLLTLGFLEDECIDPTVYWANNINNVIRPLDMGTGQNTKAHTAYALINLISPYEQTDAVMKVESGDAVKVWLNGNVVHREAAESLGCRKIDVPLACDPQVCITDPALQESRVSNIPVTLKTGNNLLLVKVRQHGEYWDMRVYLDANFTMAIPTNTSQQPDTAGVTVTAPPVTTEASAASTTFSILPSPVVSPAVGGQLTLSLNIAGGEAVAGYQATVQFDTTALRYVSSANGDYLPAGAFFVPPVVEGNRVKLAATSLSGESSGDGTLATLTFEVIVVKASTLTLSDGLFTNKAGVTAVPQVENGKITERPASNKLKGDVNGDGTVNIADLVLVASNLGKTGQNAADVNGDGVVNIADLVLVAGALGTNAAAPSLLHPDSLEHLTSADVRLWLSQAHHLALRDATSQRGIRFLEQLLAVLIPKETALLANYPNPFNPETWIPYQLSKSADVTLTIYDIKGHVVCVLDLGHQRAGMYQTRTRAAYWDGRNAVGEPVASGVYFYTLSTESTRDSVTAGDFSATRKMLIRK